MMKSFYFIAIYCLFAIGALAQQRPLFSQYLQQPYLANPALAGFEDYVDVRSGYRRQWSGLRGSPESYYITASGSLDPLSARQGAYLPMFGKSTLKTSPRAWSEPKKTALRQGLGGSLITDKLGPTRINTLQLNYAMHTAFSPYLKGSIGIGIGGRQWLLDPNDLDFEVDGDPSVGSGFVNRIFPLVSVGAMIYGNRFFVGVSTEQIIQSKLDFGTVVGALEPGRLRAHFYATAGYSIAASEDLSVIPSVMLRYASPVAPSMDFNLKVRYREKLWLGASYRTQSALAVMAGMSLSQKMMLGYSYDLSMGRAQDLAGSSHEIVLGLKVGKHPTMRSRWIW